MNGEKRTEKSTSTRNCDWKLRRILKKKVKKCYHSVVTSLSLSLVFSNVHIFISFSFAFFLLDPLSWLMFICARLDRFLYEIETCSRECTDISEVDLLQDLCYTSMKLVFFSLPSFQPVCAFCHPIPRT